MIFSKYKVQDIRQMFVNAYVHKQFIKDKTNCDMIEIIGAQFIANEPFIFGEPNEEYIARELKWYLSQSLNVNDLENTPKIWKSVADKNGFINSNYGYLVFNDYVNCGSQYDNCLNELKNHPDSRRAVMIYNRPTMYKDYCDNGRSDFICTFATQYFIRDKKLISWVGMRSNDSIFGYRNDFGWQDYVSTRLSEELNIEKGMMIWNAANLHVYERHFNLIEQYLKNTNKNGGK